MLDAMQQVAAALPSLRMPLLAMQGSEDRLVDPGAARQVYERWGGSDRTLHEYPGLWHEIFNEPQRAQVLDDTARWLNAHVGDAA
jgi:alpha-beta hydrolase superfamily lysophospholipase